MLLADPRLPLPLAYADPAFTACLEDVIATPEFVQNFDRLYGANLQLKGSPIDVAIDKACGRHDSDMEAFVDFVHDSIYLRLPDDAIESLRARGRVIERM